MQAAEHQMCPIHSGLQAFCSRQKAQISQSARKVSSIMRAKVLSIMRERVTLRLTSLFKRFRNGARQGPRIDREHNPGGETKAVRRQTATSGINPAGSSRSLRLDPLSLPVRFDAHDPRADGGVRQIELHRERVVLRRAVRGMRMAINVRVSDFIGVALRGIDEAQMLVLVHRDPSLSIPLLRQRRRATNSPRPGQMWSEIFALPQLPTKVRASPRRAGAAATRSAPAVRNSWCAGAPAIRAICRFIRANARSSRGTDGTHSAVGGQRKRAHLFYSISEDCGTALEPPLPTLRLRRPHHRVDQQSRKQQQPRIAVRLEQPQAQRGIADLEPHDLPGQMRGEGRKPEPGRPARIARKRSATPISTTASP